MPSTRLGVRLVLALCAAVGISAQIRNPIEAPVVKRGLGVEIRDVARLPETRGMRPADQDVTPAGWARVVPASLSLRAFCKRCRPSNIAAVNFTLPGAKFLSVRCASATRSCTTSSDLPPPNGETPYADNSL